MEQNLYKAKRRQGKVVALISAAAILLLFGLNLLLAYVGIQRTIFVDTTYEGLYTLTDLMKDECSYVDEKLAEGKRVKITFCADPDALIGYEITRAVYFMSLQLANTFENIEVETVNVAYNPTAVSMYKPTSLSDIVSGDVIISYGDEDHVDRYRVVSCNNFWVSMSGEIIAFNGEYKMASLIKSVTAVDRPKAYFTVGHGETYYDSQNPDRAENVDAAYLQDLLTDRGLETRTIDLSAVDKIPDDCVLLVINNPTEDFKADATRFDEFNYVTETEKIDRYLINNHGSLMVAKDFERELPLLEEFLFEWGFEFESALVKDSVNNIADVNDTNTQIVGSYNTDEDGYGMGIYSEYASMGSAPRFVLTNTGYIKCAYGVTDTSPENGTGSVFRIYSPLFFASDEASAYTKNENGEITKTRYLRDGFKRVE